MKKNKNSYWAWTAQRQLAAMFAAQGSLSNVEIARRVGISGRTFRNWLANRNFIEQVRSHIEENQRRISEEYQAQVDWREMIMTRINELVRGITKEQLSALPAVTLINLLLRLEAAIDQTEWRSRSAGQRTISVL